MRDLLVIAITALVSASAGAFLTLSVTDRPETVTEPAAEVESAGIEKLLARVAALEDREMEAPGAAEVREVPSPRAEPEPPAEAEPPPQTRAERAAQRERQQRLRIETRLRDAGWSETEIDALERIRDEARLKQEQRQYEKLREMANDNLDPFMLFEDERSVMRESMGDERYEQYLDALGRSVSVEVRRVLPGSSGDTAGLREGDRILRYGAERVFSEMDLMRAMIKGEPGEYVTVEVERDGVTMHVTVPRGPLGMSRGRGPF